MKEKIYSVWQIILGAFLGGPLAGFYLMSRNFKAMKESSMSKWFLWIGILFAVLWGLIVVFFSSTVEKIPNGTSVLSILLFLALFELMQKEKARKLLKKGNKGSWWATIGIGLICLVITVLMPAVLSFLNPDFWNQL